MSDIEIIGKALRQQDDIINILRFKVQALEAVLHNHIPNFETLYADNLVFFEQQQRQNDLQKR